jgi:hypothetical protein
MEKFFDETRSFLLRIVVWRNSNVLRVSHEFLKLALWSDRFSVLHEKRRAEFVGAISCCGLFPHLSQSMNMQRLHSFGGLKQLSSNSFIINACYRFSKSGKTLAWQL